MPVNTSLFDHVLDASCTTVQIALDKLDDHSHPGGGMPATTALNDFLAGGNSPVGTWVKKTLAETITILRTSLDSAYADLSHTHSYLSDAPSDGSVYGRKNAAWAQLGTWTNYTPSVFPYSGTFLFTLNAARYMYLGQIIFVLFDVTITNQQTGGGSVILTTPVNLATVASGGGRENGVMNNSFVVAGDATLPNRVRMGFYNGGYPGLTNYRLVGFWVQDF